KPNAILIGMGDDAINTTLYVRYVENRRADVTVLPLPELLIPEYMRLIERLNSHDLKVNVPIEYRQKNGHFKAYFSFLTSFVRDNLPEHPIYLFAIPEFAMRDVMVNYKAVPGIKKVGPSLVPLYEVTEEPTSVALLQSLKLTRKP